MKKNNVRSYSKSLVQAILRGLAVFAVFGAAVGVYAVAYPASQPNPVSGVVGLYVGKTAASDGSIGGYMTANNMCNGVETHSHVCSPMEIINTYNHNASAVTGETDIVWVNAGAPGNIAPAVTDCKGWTNNSNNPYYGTVWNFSKKTPAIQPCGKSMPVACCK